MKKKRQHYVPKFVLRNFSQDKRSVATLVLVSGKRIETASITGQCYADYFYGVDEVIENSFASEEAKASAILGPLVRSHLEKISEEDAYQLRQSVHYQRNRTLAAAQSIDDMNEAMLKYFAAQSVASDGSSRFSPEELASVRIKMRNPQQIAIYEASVTTPLLMDLELKFLFSPPGGPGFTVSDHPVVSCNQWAEHHERFRHYTGHTGLALKGLQVFMPVSPDVMIALVDSTTYEYGSANSRICSVGRRDVELLNTLQAINAHASLYFDARRTNDQDLKAAINARARHPPLRTPIIDEGPLRPRLDGKLSQLVRWRTPALKIGAKFSFVRVIDRRTFRDHDLAVLPVRSPQLVDFADRYREYVDRMIERKRRDREHENQKGTTTT